MTEKCSKCGNVLYFKREDLARGKIIKVCKEPGCSMKDHEISFGER